MKKPKLFAVLPTLLTLGNAACGFGAITLAAKVGPTTDLGGHDLFYAAALIYLAMIFDMLDGSAARWTKQTSEFGAQLDSLCDAVSFGVAPAFLMLRFVGQQHVFDVAANARIHWHPRFLWVIAALFVICVLLRLARFNVETDDDDTHHDFSGLPSPAAAGTVAAFPIALSDFYEFGGQSQRVAEWIVPAVKISLPAITLAVAFLMVSRIRYPHVFNQLFRGQRNRQHLIQLVFTIAAIFLARGMAVPLIFCYYAFASPLRAVWNEAARRRPHKSHQA